MQHSDLPLDGSSGEFEWEGFIPCHERPHCLNPDQGFVISCNHRIVSDSYPYFIGNTFKHASRAIRVKEMIEECIHKNGFITIEDCKKMQLDIKDPQPEFISKHLEFLLEEDFDKLHKQVHIKHSSVPITTGMFELAEMKIEIFRSCKRSD